VCACVDVDMFVFCAWVCACMDVDMRVYVSAGKQVCVCVCRCVCV